MEQRTFQKNKDFEVECAGCSARFNAKQKNGLARCPKCGGKLLNDTDSVIDINYKLVKPKNKEEFSTKPIINYSNNIVNYILSSKLVQDTISVLPQRHHRFVLDAVKQGILVSTATRGGTVTVVVLLDMNKARDILNNNLGTGKVRTMCSKNTANICKSFYRTSHKTRLSCVYNTTSGKLSSLKHDSTDKVDQDLLTTITDGVHYAFK